MITSDSARISALTEAGSWGVDTLHSLLVGHVTLRPNSLAIRDQPNRTQLTGDEPLSLSWLELHRASDNLANQLQAFGIESGDKVVVQMPNVAELALVYYSLSKLGAIVSPVPVQYSSHELQMIAAALEPVAMITLANFSGGELAVNARRALPEIPVLVFGEQLHVDGGRDSGCEREFEGAPQDANQTLSICWTSGTTGTPKGVPRSHNMWLATASATIEAGGYSASDVLLNPFPMVNMAALGGFLFPAAILGCALVLHHPLDVPLFLSQIQNEKITFTIVPPALLNQLAKSPELWNQFDFSALRCVGSGSAPLAPWMIEIFSRDFGKEVINFYGSNEGISLFSTPATAPEPEVRATMFPRPSPGGRMLIKVVDLDTGQEITEREQSGELLINGATVFDGYFGASHEDVFSEDGYFRTGDLVEICGENADYYRIVGRCKDIINRGGMKISPVELDLALEQHPAVAEAAVCAYPDDRLGEKICACLVMSEGEVPLKVADLQSYFLEQGFAKFKLPERVQLCTALPRNALGKVQRFALREFVEEEFGQ
jgi:cyclohexanecarboxylate-CoA ligase